MADIELKVVKNAPAPGSGVCLFAVLRDEIYFLPHFLSHYRALGVSAFVIYDDGSTDGGVEYLMRQPDVTVVRGNHPYGEPFGVDANGVARRYHEALREVAPEMFFPHQWTLVVDLDELLVIPEAFADLPSYCAYLDRSGQKIAWGCLVDVYGPTLNHRNYDHRLSPLDRDLFFDAGPYVIWSGAKWPELTRKGLRMRLLGRLHAQYPDEVTAIYDGKFIVAQPNKVPLIKHGSGVKRIGAHFTTAIPEGVGDCALLHFKFTPSTDAKLEHALQSRSYAMGSLEYRFLKFAIERIGGESLIGPQSRRFTGPDSLVAAGLLADIRPAQTGS